MEGTSKLKLESAEGCYSNAVFQHSDIKVKYAVKAFTDVFDKKVNGPLRPDRNGVFVSIGSKGDKSVIYREEGYGGGYGIGKKYRQNDDSGSGGGGIGGVGDERGEGKGKGGATKIMTDDNNDFSIGTKNLLELNPSWFEEDNAYVQSSSRTGKNNNNNNNNNDTPIIPLNNLLQWEVGPMIPIKSHREAAAGIHESLRPPDYGHCMYWAPRTYQADICARNVSKDETVYFINGKLYKQKIETKVLPGNIRTFPFFHFQDWKRMYRDDQLLSFTSSGGGGRKGTIAGGLVTAAMEGFRGWVLLPQGPIPLLSQQQQRNTSSSLVKDATSSFLLDNKGVSSVEERLRNWWNIKMSGFIINGKHHGSVSDTEKSKGSNGKFGILPLSGRTFCLLSSKRQFGNIVGTGCDLSVSWKNNNLVTVLNRARIDQIDDDEDYFNNPWDGINPYEDIVLTLTLQVQTEVTGDGNNKNRGNVIDGMLDVLESNLVGWGSTHPSVVLVQVTSIGSRDNIGDLTISKMRERFGYDGTKTVKYPHSVMGVIVVSMDSPKEVSRNALMNMAREACRTRWVISGLEVERGMVISGEAWYFARRAKYAYGNNPGSVFVLPQFSAIGTIANSQNVIPLSSPISIVDILDKKGNNQMGGSLYISSDIDSFDCPGSCNNTVVQEKKVETMIDQVWWQTTLLEMEKTTPPNDNDTTSEKNDLVMDSLLDIKSIDSLSHGFLDIYFNMTDLLSKEKKVVGQENYMNRIALLSNSMVLVSFCFLSSMLISVM